MRVLAYGQAVGVWACSTGGTGWGSTVPACCVLSGSSRVWRCCPHLGCTNMDKAVRYEYWYDCYLTTHGRLACAWWWLYAVLLIAACIRPSS